MLWNKWIQHMYEHSTYEHIRFISWGWPVLCLLVSLNVVQLQRALFTCTGTQTDFVSPHSAGFEPVKTTSLSVGLLTVGRTGLVYWSGCNGCQANETCPDWIDFSSTPPNPTQGASYISHDCLFPFISLEYSSILFHFPVTSVCSDSFPTLPSLFSPSFVPYLQLVKCFRVSGGQWTATRLGSTPLHFPAFTSVNKGSIGDALVGLRFSLLRWNYA